MRKLFRLDPSHDVALLFVPITFGLCVFAKHGWEKLTSFHEMAQTLPDPVPIRKALSLACTLIGDGVCSPFVLAGFATRLASGVAVLSLLVALARVHHLPLFGPRNGDLGLLYLYASAAMMCMWRGRYSFDRALLERGSLDPRAERPMRPSFA